MAYIYRHIRLDKNEPFYIGIGSDDKGKYTRAYSNDRNKYWKNIVQKTAYKIDIILDDVDWNEACKVEQFFIHLYGRHDKGLGPLTNLTDGGDGFLGFIISEDHKQKIGNANRKPKPEGFATKYHSGPNPKKGNRKPKTEEHKQKLRKSILQFNNNGELIQEFDSYTSARDITKIKGIANVLTHRTKSAGGFIWKYKN
jgi:hypothetical protein